MPDRYRYETEACVRLPQRPQASGTACFPRLDTAGQGAVRLYAVLSHQFAAQAKQAIAPCLYLSENGAV